MAITGQGKYPTHTLGSDAKLASLFLEPQVMWANYESALQTILTDYHIATPASGGGSYTQNILESIILAETVARISAHTIAEALPVVEVLSRTTQRIQTDAIVLIAAVASAMAYIRGMVDTVTAVETVRRSTSKALAEAAIFTEALARTTFRLITESTAAIATVTAAAVYIRGIVDTLQIADTTARIVGKYTKDVATAVDTILRAMQRIVTDATTAIDTVSRATTSTFADALIFADRAIFSTAKSVLESAAATDVASFAMTYARVLQEAIIVVDTNARWLGKAIIEILPISDTVNTANTLFTLVINESITAITTFTHYTEKRLLDTITLAARLYSKLNGVNARWNDTSAEKPSGGWAERHDHLK